MKYSFGLALGLFISSFPLAASAADVPISEEARLHFSAGVNLLQDPDGARYEEAYREFKAAYRASPSWKILGNLGISAYRLERDGEALAAFEQYLREGKKEIDAQERAQFERDAHTLRSGMVRVRLSSDPPGATISDERLPQTGAAVRNPYPALATPSEFGVRAGRHRFIASLPDRPDSVWEVDLEPGQKVDHVFTFAAPVSSATPPAGVAGPAPRSTRSDVAVDRRADGSLRTWSYVSLGVGAIGLGAGTVFAIGAKNTYDDANAFCPSFPCDLTRAQADERARFESDGDRKKTLSAVAFAVGGVGIATGVTLFLLSGRQNEPPATGLSVQPLIGLGTVGVSGGF